MNPGNNNRTKFAVGHFLTSKQDDPESFAELARRFAPRLREVYFPWPGLANGRALSSPRPNHEERLTADLKYCRGHGVKLDLLVNAMCYGERIGSGELRIQTTNIIRHLDKLGLYPEIVTTTSPYVAKLCKVDFPDIEVRASVNMELRNTAALEHLAPLFDSYYICRDVQRDLPTFHRMADWCRDHGKKLCMLVNSGCLRNCPWHVFHDLLVSHKDIANLIQDMENQNEDLLCNRLFDTQHLPEFLRSGWIRPEDIHVFEPKLETIKLSTRKVKYPFEIIEAYMNGSYDGNLLRLIDPYHGYSFRPNRIDNKSFPADWVTSGIAGKCADNCVHCGKCEQILEQVLKYDVNPATRASDFSVGKLVFLAPKQESTSKLVYSRKAKQ